MNEHLTKAMEHFLNNGFVTEFDVSSIGVKSFRSELNTQIEQYNVDSRCQAMEIEGNWMYYFYNLSEFANYNEMRKFIKKYMQKKSLAYS